jgi:hypothetical protein
VLILSVIRGARRFGLHVRHIGLRVTEKQVQAINDFFQSLSVLRKLNIVRSDVVLGDIGEFLCTVVFDGLELVEGKTNRGYDAMLGGKKIQIKFSDSPDAKNIDLGNPLLYDALILVLGKRSAHRMPDDSDADYIFYKFSKADIGKFKVTSGYKLSKLKHFRKSIKEYRFTTNS